MCTSYGAEIGYVTLMPIWIYCRLYLFPVWIIFYGVWGSMYMERAPDGEQYWCSALKGKAGEELKLAGREEFLESVFQEDCVCCGEIYCFMMLFTLLVLHIWWTFLLLRVGYRAILIGEDTHEVSNDIYFAENTTEGKEELKKKND